MTNCFAWTLMFCMPAHWKGLFYWLCSLLCLCRRNEASFPAMYSCTLYSLSVNVLQFPSACFRSPPHPEIRSNRTGITTHPFISVYVSVGYIVSTSSIMYGTWAPGALETHLRCRLWEYRKEAASIFLCVALNSTEGFVLDLWGIYALTVPLMKGTGYQDGHACSTVERRGGFLQTCISMHTQAAMRSNKW